MQPQGQVISKTQDMVEVGVVCISLCFPLVVSGPFSPFRPFFWPPGRDVERYDMRGDDEKFKPPSLTSWFA